MEDLGVSAIAGTTNRQCQRLENLRRALYARMPAKSTIGDAALPHGNPRLNSATSMVVRVPLQH